MLRFGETKVAKDVEMAKIYYKKYKTIWTKVEDSKILN